MIWIEYKIHTINEAVEPISYILHEELAEGVVIEDSAELIKERANIYGEVYDLNPDDFPADGVILKAYFAVDDFTEEKAAAIKVRVDALVAFGIELGRNEHSVSEVDDEEWHENWKKYFHTFHISDNMTVVPSWEEYTPKHDNEKIISIDPGMAFGTGTHHTTVLCVKALEKYLNEGDTVIDVGTGSGILSIAANLLGAGEVHACDLDPMAVEVAKENFAKNNCSEINVFVNDLLKGVETRANVIVANILSEIIVLFPHDVAKLLEDDGFLIVSGIAFDKVDWVVEALNEAGLYVIEKTESDMWVGLVLELREEV